MGARTRILALVGLMAASTASAGERMISLEGPLDLAAPASEAKLPATFGPELPYTEAVYKGAKQLGLSRDFVHHVAQGLELLYQRRYRETRTWFEELEQVYPGSAVAAVADGLVWQAIMLENFDFRYDDQYRATVTLARTKLDAALKVEGNEAWEHLMLGVVSGIEGIHAARRGKYLPALTLAFEAIDHMEATRRAAPEFVDIKLADGLYNYWRTVITQKSKALPDFGDNKAKGIAEMEEVIAHGVFLAAPARLSMAFTWMEEHKYDKARAVLAQNHDLYPQNVINEMMLGLTDVYARKYDAAIRTFDGVLRLDPKNRRVLYYRGLAHLRADHLDEAERDLKAYLDAGAMEDYQASGTMYRLGQLYERRKDYVHAYESYRSAVALDGNGAAKAAVDRMKKDKKDGKISF